MNSSGSFTLPEIARRLDVPQHRLIHLCEKGVVVPEIHDAAGRGSSRVFSVNNFLELAVALRLRDMMLPVRVVGVIVHVVRRFGQELQSAGDGLPLATSLTGPRAPELRVIVSDGKNIYFSLARAGQKPTLFGGTPVDAGTTSLAHGTTGLQTRSTSVTNGEHIFGGPEGSEFARMEMSVTAIARALPLS